MIFCKGCKNKNEMIDHLEREYRSLCKSAKNSINDQKSFNYFFDEAVKLKKRIYTLKNRND